MIFRWLYKRKLTQVFGASLPENAITKVIDGLSEWESFKLLLPRRIHHLFFKPVMPDIDALQTLQMMIRDTLRETPTGSGHTHGISNSPKEPD